MKSKFLIGIIVIVILIIGIYIYFAGSFPGFAPKIQDQTRIENLPPEYARAISEEVANEMDRMTEEEMMNHGQAPGNEVFANNVINYTDSGFSPSSLEIKIGESVQFVNQSNGGMWVASGPHSSHSNYPEFDAKTNIPSGGVYEFTFTKVGEWKYHNHTKPSVFGTIIVK